MNYKKTINGSKFAQAGVMLALYEIRVAIHEEPSLSPERAAIACDAVRGGTPHYHFAEALRLLQIDTTILDCSVELSECCRHALRAILMYTEVPWTFLTLAGTAVFQNNLKASSRNVLQCFEYAKLFDEDEAAYAWWDDIAISVRSNQNELKSFNGRIGERLTVEHEINRLHSLGLDQLVPVWTARKDSYAGFDVQSFDLTSDGIVKKIYIECKACERAPLSFHLTPNEVSIAKLRSSAYLIHLWDLQRSSVTKIRSKEIEPHLPENRGQGRWQDVRITWL